MALQKLSGTDAFVVIDLDGAPIADGVVRLARKVLVDGARNLARSRTYAWALLGEQISGASAGINAEGDAREAACAAFVEELTPQVSAGTLSLDPAKGLTSTDLAGLTAADQRSTVLHDDPTLHDRLLASGVVAAASVALGSLDGATIALEGAGSATDAVESAFVAAGSTIAGRDADALSSAADALVCGSKVGLVDHETAAALPHRVIVPIGPLPVTARGLAVARRRDIVVLPDFLTTAGPLMAFRSNGTSADDLLATAADRISGLTAELTDHPDGPLLGACIRAETYLATWRDELPFGRPLA